MTIVRLPRGLVVGALMLGLHACSEHSAVPDGIAALDGSTGTLGDSGSAMAQRDTDGGPSSARSFDARKLCDGSSTLRVGFEADRSEECPPYVSCLGGEVLNELGWSYLYLDGRCNVYMSYAVNSGTRVKRLGAGEFEAFVAALRLAEWPAAGSYCDNIIGLFDATGLGPRYYLTGDVIRIGHCVDDMPTVIASRVYQYVMDHYAEGEPVLGPIRYTLVPTESPDNYAFTYEKELPFASRKLVAPAGRDSAGRPTAPIMLAEGVDAEKLRVLRDAWVKVGIPQFSNFLPVVDPAAPPLRDGGVGTRFELRLRDVLPLEQLPGQETLF